MSLTPIKPGLSTGKKKSWRKSFFFRLSIQRTKRSGLISLGSADAGRPAKHLCGLNRVSQSMGTRPLMPQLTFQPRDRTPRDGPETLCSAPTRYPFKLRTAAHLGSSFLRTCGWGGVAKFFSFVGYDRELKRAGGDSEPFCSRPRRSNTARDRPLAVCPIKSTESCRAQRRPAVLWHQ